MDWDNSLWRSKSMKDCVHRALKCINKTLGGWGLGVLGFGFAGFRGFRVFRVLRVCLHPKCKKHAFMAGILGLEGPLFYILLRLR